MDNMKDELRKFFIDKKLTQKDVANVLGVAEQTINGLMNGRRKFGRKTAQEWERHFGLSAAWLMTGVGDMIVDGNKEVKNYDIRIGKDARVIHAGGNVSNSQNDGNAQSDKAEIAALKSRIK